MKKIILIALLSGSAAFGLACNGDDNNNGDGGNDSGPADTGGGDVVKTDGGSDSGIPTPPTLKTQIDRMGRPAINTALNHVFDTDAGAAGVAKDTYNADKNVSGWGAAYTPQFAANLAVFDALDTTTTTDGCGNQAAFGIAHTYATLGGLAADDRLYLDTSQATCAQYLGVELKATGIAPSLNDCGGRKLDYDVIDTTYSALAAGVLTGVGDGISAPAGKTGGTTFPYLAAPQ